MRALLLGAALVGLVSAPLEARAAAALEVEGGSSCLDARATRSRLEPLLRPFESARGGLVVVVGQKTSEGSSVTLRVVSVAGDVVLERRLPLEPADCASAPELLATILGRFLREFPRARWADPAPVPIPVPTPPPVAPPPIVISTPPWSSLSLEAGVAGRLPGPAAGVELGVALEAGTRTRRLVSSVTARLGLPQSLGTGTVTEGAALLGVGWREAWGSLLSTELSLRAGGRMLQGSGLAANRRVWLPWTELAVAVRWSLGPVALGPALAVSPLRQRATTAAGEVRTLPSYQLGLTAGLGIPLELF